MVVTFCLTILTLFSFLQIIIPETFRDAANLSNSELNSLLKKFSLSTKGKKNHKVTALCDYLRIKTTGGDNDHSCRHCQKSENWKMVGLVT